MGLLSTIIRIASELPKGDPTRRKLLRLAAYSGNPSGKPIYEHEIDHGYDEPLSGGSDVMRRLQNQYLKEQGNPERPPSPVIPKE